MICFTVNRLSQFISNPRRPHLVAIHPQWKYLKATSGEGLIFFFQNFYFLLKAYAGADWGNCDDNR